MKSHGLAHLPFGRGAESDAIDEQLQSIIDAWADLPELTRLAIYDLAMSAVH
jgi:hypothetical protein